MFFTSAKTKKYVAFLPQHKQRVFFLPQHASSPPLLVHRCFSSVALTSFFVVFGSLLILDSASLNFIICMKKRSLMTTLGLGGACWFTYSCENQLTKIKLASTYLLEAGWGGL